MRRYFNLGVIISYIGLSLSAPQMAHTQTEIKFGSGRSLTYEATAEPYSRASHFKTLHDRIGEEWGKLRVYTNESFEVWGFITGTAFYAFFEPSLSVIKIDHGDVVVILFNYKKQNDATNILGLNSGEGILIDLNSPEFFENEFTGIPSNASIENSVHGLYRKYIKLLNIQGLNGGESNGGASLDGLLKP